jgi:hypothetical protein
MYPFLAMGLAATIVQRAPGSRSIRRSAWVLTSLGLVAIPLYHCTILPAVEPGEDPDLRTARAVMTAMEPGNTVYSVSGLGEPLAWLGGDRYQTKQLGVDDAAERMRGASPGSYVVVASDLNEKFLDVAKEMSLKHVGTFPWPRRKEDLGTHPARSVLLYHF